MPLLTFFSFFSLFFTLFFISLFSHFSLFQEGGHTLHVRYNEKKDTDAWTEWFVWGSSPSRLEAVSGYLFLPSKTFRVNFAGSSSERITMNASPLSVQKKLMAMDTTGLLAVTRTAGTEGKCQRSGWCSWDITFMTNVLFEIQINEPEVSIASPFIQTQDDNNNGISNNDEVLHAWPCDADWQVERRGQAQIPQDYTPLSLLPLSKTFHAPSDRPICKYTPESTVEEVTTPAYGQCGICQGPCSDDNQCGTIPRLNGIPGQTIQLICEKNLTKIDTGCETVDKNLCSADEKNQKMLPCISFVKDLNGENTGYCRNPEWTPKTSQDMYNADVSLSGTRFGGTYPEGTLRLEDISGAEFIPFYVRAATRTNAGWSSPIEISCSPPQIATSAQTDVTSQRNVTVILPRPVKDNGARITKILLRWWSSDRLLNQIQRITVSPATSGNVVQWYMVDSASSSRGLHHWYPPTKQNTCGNPILNGASFHGGYATWGAGTVVSKSFKVPYDAAVDVSTSAVRLSFDVIFIDDWRNEEVSLSVNSLKKWQRRHQASIVTSSSDATGGAGGAAVSGCGLSQYSDATYPITLDVPLSGLSSGDMTSFPTFINLTFTSSLPIVAPSDDDPKTSVYRGSDRASWGIRFNTMHIVSSAWSAYKSTFMLQFPTHKNGITSSYFLTDEWSNPLKDRIAQCGNGLDCENVASVTALKSDADNTYSLVLDTVSNLAVGKLVHVLRKEGAAVTVPYSHVSVLNTPQCTKADVRFFILIKDKLLVLALFIFLTFCFSLFLF